MIELLRQVIGRTDELEFKIKKLNERLDVMNKDIDIRFKLLEGKPVSGGSGMLELPAQEKFAAPVAKDAPKSIVGDSIKGDDLKPLKGFDVKGIYQEGLEALKAGNDKLAEEKFNTILSKFPGRQPGRKCSVLAGRMFITVARILPRRLWLLPKVMKNTRGRKGRTVC